MTSTGSSSASASAAAVLPDAVGPVKHHEHGVHLVAGLGGRQPALPCMTHICRLLGLPLSVSDSPPVDGPAPGPPYSHLQAVLDAGHFAVTCELGPPKGPDAADVRAKAEILRGFVDAASCTDNQGAALKMSHWGAALLCRQGGVEPIMQLSCRDRNRLGIQSDVIAAQAFGIRNFMSISGDSLVLGDHPMAKPVFDLQGVQLVRLLKQLRDENRTAAGDPIKGDFRLFIGGAANPFAPPYGFRPLRMVKKGRRGTGVRADADDFQRGAIRRMDVARSR